MTVRVRLAKKTSALEGAHNYNIEVVCSSHVIKKK